MTQATKNNFLAYVFVVLLFQFTAGAVFAAKELGVGIILGDPTGLSVKYNVSRTKSFDGALAWSDSIAYHMHGDLLITKPGFFKVDNFPMDLYYGIGARLRDRDSDRYNKDDRGTQLGVRGPLGIRHMMNDPSVEFFGEVAAVFNLIPSTSLDFDIGIGARYFF